MMKNTAHISRTAGGYLKVVDSRTGEVVAKVHRISMHADCKIGPAGITMEAYLLESGRTLLAEIMGIIPAQHQSGEAE
jgi:hypothetical protein